MNFYANHTSEICTEEWGFWFLRNIGKYLMEYTLKNQSHYMSELPRGFREVKVPRLRDNGPGWW